MKTKTMYEKTKDGSYQGINFYHRNADGKYVLRFYVNNYFGTNGKKKNQWCGRGCIFNTRCEAIDFGIFVCKNIKTSRDFTIIRDFLTSNAKFLKSTSIDLMEFAA